MTLRPLLFCFMLLAGPVLACQVPVFRYALERWPPDVFQLMIYHSEPLGEKEQTVVDYLRDRVRDDTAPLNMNVGVLDLQLGTTNEFSRWYDQQESQPSSSMVLFYPDPYGKLLMAWQGELSMDHAQKLVDSPRRQEIIAGILRGDSAVWVVLETGDQEHDDAIVNRLRADSQEIKKHITISDSVMSMEEAEEAFSNPETIPRGFDPADILRSGIPLHIDFSILRMQRNEPGEEVFTAMLLNMDGGAAALSEPPQALIYPVFGQGRAIGPATAEEIENDAIFHMASYLCGACSCEVKAQNPGFDILLGVHWWEKLEGSQVIVEKGLPDLVGTSELLEAAQSNEVPELNEPPPMDSQAVADAEQEVNAHSSIRNNMVVMLLVVLGGLAFFTIKALRSTR